MTSLSDDAVQALLTAPNYAVISSHNSDGSILSTVVWVDATPEEVIVNSAVGRTWPTNLDRDPHVSVVVSDPENPFNFVEVRGTATGSTEGADDVIDGLAKKYLGQDKYPFRQPGEERITYRITPTRVRLISQ